MGATLNFYEIWLKLLEDNFYDICVAYSTSMKEMFKQIPTTMMKLIHQIQKVQKLMTEIGGGRYMKKKLRDYHH